MEITHKSCFFVFRIHFHYVLSYLFGLFGVRTCVSILWHISLPKKCNFAWKNSEKIAKNHDFGDFRWFSCFWHDVTYDVSVASYKVCLYFFWYQWTREGHSYPLVPHNWYFVNRFPRSWGPNPPPPSCEMGPKSPALLGLRVSNFPHCVIKRLRALNFPLRHQGPRFPHHIIKMITSNSNHIIKWSQFIIASRGPIVTSNFSSRYQGVPFIIASSRGPHFSHCVIKGTQISKIHHEICTD